MSEELPTEEYDPKPDARKSSATTGSRVHSSGTSSGKNFAHFRLLEKLGSGAFGTVYRAYDSRLNREVAIKVPTKRVLKSPQLRKRFAREARAAAAVQHLNICPIFEVGEHQDIPFYSMALLRGGSLRQAMGRQAVWTPRQVLGLIKKLANALAAAHDAGLIHRDLKPENILIDDQGQPVIADFGLAKRSTTVRTKLTETGVVLGTPAYMAPEQLSGDDTNPACDVFSLGVIFYELLCGTRPFEGHQQHVLKKIAAREWTPSAPNAVRSDIPKEVSDLVMRCLGKGDQQRVTTMKSLLNELQNVSRSMSTEVQRPTDITTDPRLDSLIDSLAGLGTQPQHKVVPLAMWIPGSVLTAAIVLIGFFAFFQSDYGKVRLQLNIDTTDPAITVSLDDKIVDPASLSRELELPAGPHELVVMRNGVELERYEFEVVAGATTVEDFGAAPKIANAPQFYDIAKEWLAVGAVLTVMSDDLKRSTIGSTDALPTDEFRLTGIYLSKNASPTQGLWETLRDLSDLHTLHVEGAGEISDTMQKVIGGVKSLRELRLPGLQVDAGALIAKGRLDKLEVLNLRGSVFDETAQLEPLWKNFTSLRRLTLANTNLAIENLPLNSLPRLEYLDIDATRTTDLAGEWLAAHPTLSSLSISGCNISGELFQAWPAFTKLQSLALEDCLITDADLEPLLDEADSKELSMSGTYVTEALARRFQQRWPAGKITWDPNRARFLDEDLATVVLELGGNIEWSEAVRGNEAINLNGARINEKREIIKIDLALADRGWEIGDWLPLIARLPSLKSLSLRGISISDIQASVLRRAGKLQELDLALTDVTDIGVSLLCDNPRLRSLVLDGATLSENVTKAFDRGSLESLTIVKRPGEPNQALASLRFLMHLKSLQLEDIPLGELLTAIPDGLSSLEELSCNVAKDTDVEELAAWKSLRALNISARHITDGSLPFIRKLSNIEALDLSGTAIEGQQLALLKALPLHELTLNFVPLSAEGVLALSEMPRIETLHLQGTAVDNFSLAKLTKIGNLKSLNVVDAWTTPSGRREFRAAMPGCELLPADEAAGLNPQSLDALLNRIFSENGWVELKGPDGSVTRADSKTGLPPGNVTVVRVDLSASPKGLTDEDVVRIAALKDLKELSLYGRDCKDRAMAQLQELTELQSLTLSNVGVTDRGLRYLLACPKLRQLRIANTELTDKSGEILARLPELEFLQLNQDGLTGEILASISVLPGLTKLDVSFPVRGYGRYIARMPVIDHFVLTSCEDLNNEDFEEIARLRNVRQLTVRDCRLSASARTALGSLKRISRLTLEDVVLTPSDLKRLGGMSQLNHLSLKEIPLGREEVRTLMGLRRVRALTLKSVGLSEADSLTLQNWCDRQRIKLVIDE